MAIANLSTGYGIYLQTDLSGPTLVGGITKQRSTTDTKAIHEVSAGNYYPYYAGISEQMPKGEFTTRDLDAFFTLVLPPCAALDGIGCQLFQVAKKDGKHLAGSVHRLWGIENGVVVPQRLSIQQGQSAEVSAQVFSRGEAGSEPIAPTETSALATVLDDPVRYSMGPGELNGVTLDGKTSLEIDFGVKADQVAIDGDVWPSWVDVAEYLAKVTIKSVNTALVSAAGIPLVGKAGTHANSSFYLRRRDGAGFASGSSHIKLTVDGLAYAEDIFDASGNERGECSIVIICRFDGTNPPIDIALAQSLPT